MIRVLIADDQSPVRAGFTALLDARDDIEVVGETPDGAGAVDLARKLRPDVILMDIRVPGLKGALHNRGCSWGLNPPVSSSDLAM